MMDIVNDTGKIGKQDKIGLTRFLQEYILVHMSKRFVRQSEQRRDEDAHMSRLRLPAPMVERAFRLLDLLSLAEEGMTLSELSRQLSMSKGSMHGLLKTLEACGIVEQTDEKLYVAGPYLFDLAQRFARGAGLRRLVLPAMQRLAEATGETVILGREETIGVRINECVRAENEHLHISARPGTIVHFLAGATGRVVLASWSPERRESFLRSQPLPTFTRRSISDPERWLREVAETERTGVGIDYEEYLTGVNAVAAPITGPGRNLVALLWIVGFASRFDRVRVIEASRLLSAEVQAISRALGGA